MVLSLITPQLFLGNANEAENFNELKMNGITHIVQAMGGMEIPFPREFQYKALDLQDIPNENISRYFDETVRWISSAIDNGGKVFVHCWAGISRSTTIVIAFLMYKLCMTMDSAMLMVRRARPQINPNDGFMS